MMTDRIEEGGGMTDVQEVDAQTVAREGSPAGQQAFDRLVRTVWRLRQPDGCPWDRVQTHESICKNMIEEAYEAVDALESGDRTHEIEELGDVLLQVLLHAQIAADDGEFTLDEVCDTLNEKLVRRHPHVFGELAASDEGQALANWDAIKDAERSGEAAEARASVLDSVPSGLPALMQAQKISKRLVREGVEAPGEASVTEKVAAVTGADEVSEEAAGEALYELAGYLQQRGIDAEEALRHACGRVRAGWDAANR
jgi:tetrapyrrole methylase family protein/MazG family protein